MSLKEFKRLISADSPVLLHDLCLAAQKETQKYFGKTVQLYAPLYLSNECINGCAYCGFNRLAKIKRKTLTEEQLIKEARFLKRQGFQHVLLLTGEDRQAVAVDRLENAISQLKELFVSVAIEVYPLSQTEYAQLVTAGADGLTIYQETYHRPTYQAVHLDGPKRDYDWRYGAAERAAQVGMRKIGLGFLLGLYDWHFEAVKLAEHLEYLLKKYWQTQFQLSFPRLNPAETSFRSRHRVSDRELLRLIAAFRLTFPQIAFILSTREKAELRNKIFPFGITQMSAGSKTYPGGYTLGLKSGQQFAVADNRSPRQVCRAIIKQGYEPVWKDWDRALR